MRLLTLTLALITAAATSAAPLPPVTTRGEEFVIGDEAFRFVGVNLRGISHYGEGDILVWTSAGNRTENLDGVAAMGGRVIRLFAPIPNPNLGPGLNATEELIERLGTLLDQCEARGIYAIVALTDFYHASGFRVPGDDAYYTDNGSGWVVLNDAWFAGGYQTNYLPWVQAVVTEYQNHTAVFSWQLGNEMTDHGGSGDNIVPFTQAVAAAIRAIDADTMISFGGLGVDHFGYSAGSAQFIAMFTDPNIDFVTIHTYNNAVNSDTYEIAYAVEKPIIVSETGNDRSLFPDRPATLTGQLANWMDTRDARGVMQWGFQSQSMDIGDGDGVLGMDSYSHPDFAGLFSAYQTRATAISGETIIVTAAELPSGENLALGAAAWSTSSDFNASNGGDKAIDGVISNTSKWTSDATAGPHWLALDLGGEYRVTGAIVRAAGAANEWHEYDLVSLAIQTGDSISGPWTTQATHSDTRQRNRAVCLFPTPVDTRFVRLLVTDAGFDNYARVPEFEVYGAAPVTAAMTGHLYR